MKALSTIIAGALLSVVAMVPPTVAQQVCVTRNHSVPPGANTTDRSAPFLIDTTGLNLSTQPPTRDPRSPNYPPATELPDGTLPPAGAEGNFIIGPTHHPAPETVAREGVPRGTIRSFTFYSSESVIYNPGVVRDDPPNCTNGAVYSSPTVPGDKSNLLLTASHPGSWTRTIDVYVPAQYIPGTEVPFIVFGDGGPGGFYPGRDLFTTLDNLIAQRRVPVMVAIGIGTGGQDAPGSERGREYDAVSGTYAEWVEREVLPRVERHASVRLTKNPEGRATMGISSSGQAAFSMAWFHPELYHRVLAYSPTMINAQWPHETSLRGGAWEYHSAWAGPSGPSLTVTDNKVTSSDSPVALPLIPANPAKPIRYWFMVGDRDNFYTTLAMADGMHDWVLGNENMAKVLAAKGYHYQFVFVRNAVHVDRPTVAQTLPSALEWLWRGYPVR